MSVQDITILQQSRKQLQGAYSQAYHHRLLRQAAQYLNYERPIAIACDEHDKTAPPCVFITDVFIRRLIYWKLEFCTPREAGVDCVRAWETAGRCAAVDRGNRRRDETRFKAA